MDYFKLLPNVVDPNAEASPGARKTAEDEGDIYVDDLERDHAFALFPSALTALGGLLRKQKSTHSRDAVMNSCEDYSCMTENTVISAR